MNAVSDTLVVGLGNPLRGDDGVGVVVAQALAERALPDGVEVVDGGTAGLELVNLMEGWPRLIVVDAAHVGREPGEFVRFRFDPHGPPSVKLPGDDGQISVHDAGLGDALLLAQVLGVLSEQVVVFGVQPARVDWDCGLSSQVEAALPALVEAVVKEIAVGGEHPGEPGSGG
jgi:hydrogenase maturation protease